MRTYVVMRYVGITLVLLAGVMLLVLAYSLVINDGAGPIFLYSGLITFFTGLFPVLFVPHERQLSEREGYSIVVYAWLAVCFWGMIPYALYGKPFDLASAWFESASGFTTTGATMLSEVEALPKSVLLYRALTHWVGGMGVVAFVSIVIPALGKARMTLSRSEISVIAQQDYRQRTSRILEQMGLVYIGITVAVLLSLLLCGIPLFDAFLLAFSTVSTGGFAPTTMSVATYQSVSVEVVLMLFMIISCLHFGLLYSALRGNWRGVFRSKVVRLFLLVLALAVTVVTLNLHFTSGKAWGASLREGSFMIVSLMSTTGFATADANLWPQFSQLVLMLVIIVGGCSGSTAGGIKVDRLAVMLSGVRAYVGRLMHPQGVIRARLGREVISEEVVNSTFVFMMIYIVVALFHAMLVMLAGFDMKTSLSATLACIANAGPGLGRLTSFDTYGIFPGFIQVSCGILMIVGRLEIFALLVALTPHRFR